MPVNLNQRQGFARQITAVMLILALIGNLPVLGTACSRPAAAYRTAGLHLVTSFLPMYLFTANLIQGIDGITLENMAAPETGCLHDYRLQPADLIKLAQADLFIINGAGMEGFMDELARQNDRLQVIEASTGIDLLPAADGTGNPHVWLSIRLAIRQVQNISRGLQVADPQQAARIQINETPYVAKLQTLQERFKKELSQLPKREIITFHEAFPYFAAEYGLTIAAVVEREPGSEPTALELAKTIDLIRTRQITALFAEPQYPQPVAEAIARETGARVYILDPIVTGLAAPETYETVMEQNLQVLLRALMVTQVFDKAAAMKYR